MAQNKSLSTQEVAEILHVSRSTIYDLIRRGEIHSYKIGRKVRFTQDDVDAYIARSRHEHSTKPVRRIDTHSTLLSHTEQAPDLILAGQDVLLDVLASHLQERGVSVGRSYLSSFEGLLSLYEGRIHVCACHLWAQEENTYNVPFVRRLMPGVPATLINLSYRMQGFYVQKGNPKNITGWKDLRRGDLTILNRRTGSSPRILLDSQLMRLGIPAAQVRGYDREMKSHLTMAAAIAAKEADLAIGTERISRQVDGIDFIPLQQERYDLVVRRELLRSPEGKILMEILQSPVFRQEAEHFSGNDYRDLGKIVMEV